MKLDSARELKAQLLADGHKSLADAATTLGFSANTPLFGISRTAQPRGATPISIPGTYAVGIGVRPGGEHTVEVRFQSKGKVQSFIKSTFAKILSCAAKKEVNFQEIGIVNALTQNEKLWYQGRTRPLKCGASVGHYSITAGTIGGFVKTNDGGSYLLSNNHVLAASNKGKKGDAIYQPGSYDGGTDEDKIATLDKYVTISATKPNLVDCAIGYLIPGTEYYPAEYEGIGRIKGFAPVEKITDKVYKLGRTTGLKKGTVLSTDMDNLVVNFGSFMARFDQQVEIEGDDGVFCRGGDSGSMIIDDNKKAVALLFAGSDALNRTYGCTMENVLSLLKVELEL